MSAVSGGSADPLVPAVSAAHSTSGKGVAASGAQGIALEAAATKPHVKVSWQVSGIRRDAYAKAHPMIVDQEKPSAERGFFLHPQAHGQPEDRGIAERRRRVKEV